MSAVLWLAVGVLGGAGAVARFVLDGAVTRRVGGGFPAGIFAVNVSGALLLGVLVGAGLDGDAERALGAGLLGSYTTFSAWVYDSHRLAGERRRALALANLAGSLILGLAAVWLGRTVGSAL